MEEQTPKKFHFTKQMKIGLAVVLVLCIGCGLVYLDTAYGSGKIRSLFVKSSVTQNKGNPSAGVLAEIPLDAGSSTSFAVFDQAFLLCTKDGAKYYNSVGDQKWNDTFTMTTPTVIQEGSFMAVGDLGGKNVRVYDESGLLYNVQLEGNLSQFALNQNGYLSLLEKKDSGYEVKIYNSKGTLLKGRVEETAGVYPISTDVSDDNKSFAVSYVVDYVSFQQKDRVVLTLGDALPGEEGKEEGTICWLGANGAEEASYVSGKDITYLSAWKDGIVVGTDHTYIGIRHTGREAWTYQATQDVTDVIPMESFSRVLVVGQDMARILDMDKYTGELPDVPEDAVETTPEVQTDEPLPTEGETNTDATQQDAGAEGTEGQEKTSGTEGETDASGAQKTETPKTEAATDTEKTETTQPAENTESGDVPAES